MVPLEIKWLIYEKCAIYTEAVPETGTPSFLHTFQMGVYHVQSIVQVVVYNFQLICVRTTRHPRPLSTRTIVNLPGSYAGIAPKKSRA
jgi:hypothetical protein